LKSAQSFAECFHVGRFEAFEDQTIKGYIGDIAMLEKIDVQLSQSDI